MEEIKRRKMRLYLYIYVHVATFFVCWKLEGWVRFVCLCLNTIRDKEGTHISVWVWLLWYKCMYVSKMHVTYMAHQQVIYFLYFIIFLIISRYNQGLIINDFKITIFESVHQLILFHQKLSHLPQSIIYIYAGR